MMRWITLCAFVVVSFAVTSSTYAETERIHSYHSDITIEADASLRVTETIRVTSTGDKIKRGVYRDFPTIYNGDYNTRIIVPFNVVSVKRDGNPEPYHIKGISNGKRVFVGEKDVLLPPGEYTYEIIYTTNYQLGYFDDHDELYWNVTGNGWEFPMDKVTATVHLPAGVPMDQVKPEGYTGPKDSKETALTAKVDSEKRIATYAATRVLNSKECLTVVASFPKGHVDEPTAVERRQRVMESNWHIVFALIGTCGVVAYYLLAWYAVGRDPKSGGVYPQFEPPLGMPPACVRFVREMGYDKKCFSAALLSMAVKQYLVIEDDRGEYTLSKSKNLSMSPLSAGERAIAKKMLKQDSIVLKQKNHKKIKKGIEGLQEWLKLEYEGKLFFSNRGWAIGGVVLSMLTLVVSGMMSKPEALFIVPFMAVWLSGWTIGVASLLTAAFAAWRGVFSLRPGIVRRLTSLGGAIFLTAFSVPFLVGEVFGITMLVAGTGWWIIPFITLLGFISWLFWHLLRRPTPKGQKVMDDIDGFRMYLSAAEAEFLERMHPPEKTPELFERYLPYAVALDVENQWADQFTEVLARAMEDPDQNGGASFTWYHGASFDAGNLTQNLGGLGSALSNAASSSSSAPGSSSGSGGGGSSGGGGGGGGGGGW